MTPDPVTIAAVTVILFSLAAGANQILRLVDRIKEQPSPSETYATKSEMRDHKLKTENTFIKIGDEIGDLEHTIADSEAKLRDEAKRDTALIYNKVNSVAEDVSGLKATDKLRGEQLSNMDAKLTRLLSRGSSHLP